MFSLSLYRVHLSILVVFALMLGLAACGEPAGNGEEIKDDPQSGHESLEPDQCQNDADLDWLHSEISPEETGRDFARDWAGDCGLGCLSSSTPGDCAIRCMINQGVQLSEGCAGCYGFIVLCTIEDCLQQCIDDPHSDICDACQEEKGCNDEFYTCTGNLD